MEFLKQISDPCGGTVLEHTKKLLCLDKKSDVLQKFTALASNEHSFHVTRIDLALRKTSKMCIQGTSCHHHEFYSTDSLLFIHKNKLDPGHYYLTLVRALVYTYYFLPQSTGHGGKRLSHFPDLPAITGRYNRELYQKLAKSSSLQFLPMNVSE